MRTTSIIFIGSIFLICAGLWLGTDGTCIKYAESSGDDKIYVAMVDNPTAPDGFNIVDYNLTREDCHEYEVHDNATCVEWIK